MAVETKNLERKRADKLIGQRLLKSGLITQVQLDLTLREQKRQGIYLGAALENLGFVSSEVIASVLAEETGAELVDVVHLAIDPDVLELVPYDLAKRHELIPISRDDDTVTIAMADTFDVVAIDAIEHMTGLRAEVKAASEHSVLEALDRHYAAGISIDETISILLQGGVSAISDDITEKAPMIRLVDQIVALAVKKGATDIHVEPDEKILRIRMRVDGVLRQEVLMPKPLQDAVIARFKIMANMNVTEKRTPLDGRITFLLGLRKIDLRVSTMPTHFGESVVIRILDKTSVALDFTRLGFSKLDQEAFETAIDLPYGIILVTGPTGSGKTTTLYTALSNINAIQKSVFTLEDPIEYQLPIIRQTQIRSKTGMTFSAGLRGILRQDPDVILVGEIRDTETAELSMRAALTGHLVLSTLHTNDAIGAIPRLIDMDIEPYLLASVLSMIVAQRLLRRICGNCKREIENPERLLAGLDVESPRDKPLKLWDGEGCDACSGTGYKGRLGIFEVMRFDHSFHDPLVHGPDLNKILNMAKDAGMKTMFEDGMDKVFDGLTTLEEVVRVVK